MFYPRVALAILGFFAASAYGVVLALVRRDRSRVAHDTARALVRLMRPPLGIHTEVRGREHLSAHRPCIYVSNHQSAYDVPVLAELYPTRTAVIGKQELRRVPFFGWVFKATGNILIDRKDNPRAVGRMREAEEAITRGGMSVWIFPEGTRAKTPGRLLPFKKGAFYMSVATGAPLVPIVMEPVQPFFDPARRHLRPGTVRVRVLEPVFPPPGGGEADVLPLLEMVQGRMQEMLSELQEERSREPSA